ncbi:hypothetical protein [Cupriavidus pauculus]|uniref:Lipoprotein n=1 Tax=Cupriavidus pauculus TaxID=82633 RepID=A0A2N5C5L5_9BURK|nr:hypothetical protein [Cupriavidus pauculus]PLP97512.1 hypothetical protein CYJ10_27175 [Cupriavidus pauculus]
MKYSILALTWLVAGCMTQVTLVDPSGKSSYFQLNPAVRTVSGAIDGKRYAGSYVLNQSTWHPVFADARDRLHQPAAWTSSGSSGRALLFATDGSNLHCDFAYQGLTVLGRCQASSGVPYVLTSDKSP